MSQQENRFLKSHVCTRLFILGISDYAYSMSPERTPFDGDNKLVKSDTGESDTEWYLKTVEQYFRERRIKAPPIRFDVLYISHEFVEEVQPIIDSISAKEGGDGEIDVIAPALMRWNSPNGIIFQKIISGELKPDEIPEESPLREKAPFYFELAKRLYDLKKPVVFADLPSEHELMPDILRSADNLFLPEQLLRYESTDNKLTFEDALVRMTERGKEFWDLQRKREMHFVSKLGPVFERLLA